MLLVSNILFLRMIIMVKGEENKEKPPVADQATVPTAGSYER